VTFDPQAPPGALPGLSRGVQTALLVGLVGFVVAVGAAKRGPSAGPIIDGFPIGEPMGCGVNCEELVGAARTALDSREPGHAEVISTAFFMEDMTNPVFYPDQAVLRNRSGTLTVVVFSLADGSQHATGVCYCGTVPAIPLETYPH